MKKYLLTFYALLACSMVFAGNGDGYSIKGNIAGLKDTVVFLGNYYGDKQYLKDTVRIDANGDFIFSGDKLLPGGIYLIVTPRKSFFELIIDKKQKFSFKTDTLGFVKYMKVTGSEDNQLFYDYLKYTVSIETRSDSLERLLPLAKTREDSIKIGDQVYTMNKALNDFRLQFIKEHPDMLLAKVFKALPEPDVLEKPAGKDSSWTFYNFRSRFFDNVDITDDRLLRTPIFHAKLEKYLTKLVPQIPDTINRHVDSLLVKAKPNPEMFKYITWWVTYHYETSPIMGLDYVFMHMVKAYYNKGLCPWTDSVTLKKMNDRVIRLDSNIVGHKAPDLKMLTMYMKPIAMHEIKSKWLVVVFWNPDCGVCKHEIPRLDSLYKAVRNKYNLEVFAVNEGGNQQEWVDYVNEHKLEWINAWDPYNQSNYRMLYDAALTPTLFLLNSERKIVAEKVNINQLVPIMDNELAREKNQ